MHENDTARQVVDAAFHVHKELGPGLLESIYHRAFEYELEIRKINFVSEYPVQVRYKGRLINVPYRVDLLVNDHLVVELKSIEKIEPVHKKQLMTYLKLTNTRLGLLINFNVPLIKNGITRIVDNLPE